MVREFWCACVSCGRRVYASEMSVDRADPLAVNTRVAFFATDAPEDLEELVCCPGCRVVLSLETTTGEAGSLPLCVPHALGLEFIEEYAAYLLFRNLSDMCIETWYAVPPDPELEGEAGCLIEYEGGLYAWGNDYDTVEEARQAIDRAREKERGTPAIWPLLSDPAAPPG